MLKSLIKLIKPSRTGASQKTAVASPSDVSLPYSGLILGLRFQAVHGFRAICCGSCACYAGAADVGECVFPPPAERGAMAATLDEAQARHLGRDADMRFDPRTEPAPGQDNAADQVFTLAGSMRAARLKDPRTPRGGFVPITGICAYWRERGTVPGLFGDVEGTRTYARLRGMQL